MRFAVLAVGVAVLGGQPDRSPKWFNPCSITRLDVHSQVTGQPVSPPRNGSASPSLPKPPTIQPVDEPIFFDQGLPGTLSPESALVSETPSAPSIVPKKYEVREAMKLELLPFVTIGVKAVRSGPRHDPPPGHRVACPTDRAYCIDYRSSDNGTCMFPDPLEIKRCYDDSCAQSAWGPIVRKQQGEDTYCKDFMTPSGRVCQWLDTVPCTCQSKAIFYYSGEFIPNDEPMPYGFKEVFPCIYPLDVIKKAAEEAARKAGQKKRKGKQVGTEDPESSATGTEQPRSRARRYQAEDESSSSHSVQCLIASIVAAIITLA